MIVNRVKYAVIYLHLIVPVYLIDNFINDISCYNKDVGHTLPLKTESTAFNDFEKNNIFFLETSCRGNLNERQACAIESAARSNPNSIIKVLFAGPVTEQILHSDPLLTLTELNNVRLGRIHIGNYTKGTALEYIFKNNILKLSSKKVYHVADVLKYLTLHKFGGIYLDMDIIVVKAFNFPKNWFAKVRKDLIGTSALGLSNGGLGRALAMDILKTIRNTTDPHDWKSRIRKKITSNLEKLCSPKPVKLATLKYCEGVRVLPNQYFYPFTSKYWHQHFEYIFNTRNKINNISFAYHTWDSLSRNTTIHRASLYGYLAEEYCPKIYYKFADKFGGINRARLNEMSHTNSRKIYCHSATQKDDLPRIEDRKISQGRKNIFFIETSCLRVGKLNVRQACAVESAARANKLWNIHVLFLGPVPLKAQNAGPTIILKKVKNIKLFRIYSLNYTKGTYVEKLFARNISDVISYKKHRYFDAFKYLTLYKFGGTYLDFDTIVVRSFDELPENWVAKEDDDTFAAGAFAVSREGIGHDLMGEILQDMEKSFYYAETSFNSKSALVKGLEKVCSNPNLFGSLCQQDIKILNSSYFYPIPSQSWGSYFDNCKLPLQAESAYAYNLWDKYSKNVKIPLQSWYARLAEEYCPTMYNSFPNEFGKHEKGRSDISDMGRCNSRVVSVSNKEKKQLQWSFVDVS